ncbi:MAG TPA: PEP-CTERM system TPR-repeat protein PrsT [Accumulibacter sp.]|nr:PEP-CTERM system TPR-repeat protein PrsT [Accumulibacter sp.]HMW18134.1 PEP-CTERM system TPR-repeat protein PrsT [Accumulibacter sp.]HMY05965.1 PEP-CTERM system TPR-repeat protein PrsT [Accumulibacter sp.]HNC18218.1 PEP-CTERM system TPR-repeat protein PrsT [Accumulibacter sp.]HND81237.1 PEP-CTERM system TPR-repeat protein PrsT [Accumulibacter sp.]
MISRNGLQLIRRATVSVLLATLLLTGCGGDKPENSLASAKDYLTKNDRKAAVIQLKNALQANPDFAEARYMLGKIMVESGDPGAGMVELRKAQTLNFPPEQVVPLLARAALSLGRPEQVIDEFSKFDLKNPEAKAQLLTYVGQAYLAQGKKDLAANAYDTALGTLPNHAPALIGQARLKAANNDLPGALALIDSALEKSPTFHEAMQVKGQLLAYKGDAEGSMASFRKALEVKPDYLPAHEAIILRLLTDGKTDEAAKQLDDLKKIAPGHPRTAYLRAGLAYQQKNIQAAKDAILQHLKSMPSSPLGLQLAGLIEYEQKNFTQAEIYLAKALSNVPQLSLARRMLITIYLNSGRPDKALTYLEPVLEQIDKDSNMLALAGQVYLQNGQVEKAGDYFAKASALDPKNPVKRTSLAMVNMAKGETDIAFHELEKIAANDAGNRADLALITSHLKRNEFDAALKAIDALEKKQPDDPVTHNLRALAFLGKKDVPQARKSFEKAIALKPGYMPAVGALANLDLTEKKPDEAKKRFETVLTKEPKNIQAHLALAEYALKTGATTEEIAAQINKAVGADPTNPAPRLALIGLYIGKKDSKRALTAANEAVAAFPERPDVLDAAGRAQQSAGDHNQAIQTYRKLAQIKPDSALPHLRIAEINLATKNKDAALESLRKALELNPDSLEAQRGIMGLELENGRTREALAIAQDIQKRKPKSAIGYLLEADAHLSKKSWPQAIDTLRLGLKQVGSGEIAAKLHTALSSAGQTADAEKFADSWLKEHSKDAIFRLYLAEWASGNKDFSVAARQYRILLDAQPENPAILNNMAWVSSQLKDPKAIEYAEKANRFSPNQPAVMDTLAVILSEGGSHARSLEIFQKALELAPQAAPIRLNYARALLKAGKQAEAKAQLDQLAKLGDKFSQQAEVSQLFKGL